MVDGLSSHFIIKEDNYYNNRTASNNNNNDLGNIEKEQNKHISKSEIERLIKLINHTNALNKSKRSEIEVHRKERNLYDQVFRNLEYKILKNEKQLLDLIQKSRNLESEINDSRLNYNNLEEKTKNDTNEEIVDFIKQQEFLYKDNIKKNIGASRKSFKFLEKNSSIRSSLKKNININESDDLSFTNKEQENDLEKELDLIDYVIRSFKLEIEENDLEEIIPLISTIDLEIEKEHRMLLDVQNRVLRQSNNKPKVTEEDSSDIYENEIEEREIKGAEKEENKKIDKDLQVY